MLEEALEFFGIAGTLGHVLALGVVHAPADGRQVHRREVLALQQRVQAVLRAQRPLLLPYFGKKTFDYKTAQDN